MGIYAVNGLGQTTPQHQEDERIFNARFDGNCQNYGYDCVNLTEEEKENYIRERDNFNKIVFDIVNFRQVRGRNDRDRIIANCTPFVRLWMEAEKAAARAEGRPVGDPRNVLMLNANPLGFFNSYFGCLPPNIKKVKDQFGERLARVAYPPGVDPENLELKHFISEKDLPPEPAPVVAPSKSDFRLVVGQDDRNPMVEELLPVAAPAVPQPPTVTAPPVQAPISQIIPVAHVQPPVPAPPTKAKMNPLFAAGAAAVALFAAKQLGVF